MSSNIQTKAIVGTAVATGALAAGILAFVYKKLTADLPPQKWKCVGEVMDMNLFPIKSCAPIKKTSFDCGPLGLQDGILQDRVFMIVTLEGQFVTGRAYPKMVLIQSRFDGNRITLSAPERGDIVIDVDEVKKRSATTTVYVWHQPVVAVDVGDQVAQWVSEFILGADKGLRLVFYPEAMPTRNVRGALPAYKKLRNTDAGAYHDATGYMLINQASIDDLNTRIDHFVKPLQFRPNIVIKGPKAFAEDRFKWIRIGDNVIFRAVKPCTRCIFTNIDPVTGQRNPKHQPYTKLKEYRRIAANEQLPVMGVHIGLRDPGRITIGDPIYVEDNDE